MLVMISVVPFPPGTAPFPPLIFCAFPVSVLVPMAPAPVITLVFFFPGRMPVPATPTSILIMTIFFLIGVSVTPATLSAAIVMLCIFIFILSWLSAAPVVILLLVLFVTPAALPSPLGVFVGVLMPIRHIFGGVLTVPGTVTARVFVK